MTDKINAGDVLAMNQAGEIVAAPDRKIKVHEGATLMITKKVRRRGRLVKVEVPIGAVMDVKFNGIDCVQHSPATGVVTRGKSAMMAHLAAVNNDKL